jgi:hypothetical protein
MVRVLAIGPKVRGFRPGRGDGLLRAIKIRSTSSFGGRGSNIVGPMLLDCTAFKNHFWKFEKKYFARPNLSFFANSSCLVLDESAGRFARELW